MSDHHSQIFVGASGASTSSSVKTPSPLRNDYIIPSDLDTNLDGIQEEGEDLDGDTKVEEEEQEKELTVTFNPPLFIQRRIWVLDILRAENITKVLDVGCGEGQLLSVLCQPAPWLAPPPPAILPHNPSLSPTLPPATPIQADQQTVTSPSSDLIPPSPVYNDDAIPNLHVSHLWGLDIDDEDLRFAIEGIIPPGGGNPDKEINHIEDGNGNAAVDPNAELDIDVMDISRYERFGGLRWEPLEAKIWKGGLEVVNEEFVGVECIVCTEVIEHLPPDILPTVGPTLLGIYHPKLLLITTPSFNFNARFTSPTAPDSARQGFIDPTDRTKRIFRHHDHKFEWTRDEFKAWCTNEAREWGYEVQVGTLGRPTEDDPWGRDEELEGASAWALFRCGSISGREQEMEKKARDVLCTLKATATAEAHQLIASHHHPAHPRSKLPRSLQEIGEIVKCVMEGHRNAFMRVEELWFDRDVSIRCGGWIEFLVRAIEETDGLKLKKYVDAPDGTIERSYRDQWTVELIGGVTSSPERLVGEVPEEVMDYVPAGWTPDEEGTWMDSEGDDTEGGGSTGVDGDISWGGSEAEEEDGDNALKPNGWGMSWKTPEKDGNADGADYESARGWDWGHYQAPPSKGVNDEINPTHSSRSSTGGWDGDESDGQTTS
ncbi:hypothetical protein BDN72DRAFT_833905 [Pluteus cervinus]|uniref:Uncharacterized protein n=1 Tax=Pluteus cervinus TaxID=181527 RepID=A0ACD3B958_9AGAR|nr:hypothetical protein BDN72DRAFT_833905 [Pluteus cervinus]